MKSITELSDDELQQVFDNPQEYAVRGMVINEMIRRAKKKDEIQFQKGVNELYEKVMKSGIL